MSKNGNQKVCDLTQPRSEGNPQNEGKETSHCHTWAVSLEKWSEDTGAKAEGLSLGGSMSGKIWTS